MISETPFWKVVGLGRFRIGRSPDYPTNSSGYWMPNYYMACWIERFTFTECCPYSCQKKIIQLSGEKHNFCLKIFDIFSSQNNSKWLTILAHFNETFIMIHFHGSVNHFIIVWKVEWLEFSSLITSRHWEKVLGFFHQLHDFSIFLTRLSWSKQIITWLLIDWKRGTC